MTSSYRSNAKEEVLRARYDGAKRTLEGIAAQEKHIRFSSTEGELSARLDDALQVMGFEKKRLRKPDQTNDLPPMMDDGHPVASTIDEVVVYVRERDGTAEILADHAFDKNKIEMKIYYLIDGQDVQGWYHAISNHVEEYKRKPRPRVPISYIMVSAMAVALTNSFVDAMIGGAILSGAFLTYRAAKHIFDNPSIPIEINPISGPKALKYIADTPFEDVLEYHDAPVQARVEEYDGPSEQELVEQVALSTAATLLRNK